jgi:hypothetical protein
VTVGSSLATKNLIIALAICAAIVAGVPAASSAADLRFSGGKYAGTSWGNSNWRERCAYAGYYRLYAWHGSVYHLRWDDYLYPSAFSPWRQRTRY